MAKAAKKNDRPVWVMPKWMEPYREFIDRSGATGGNAVEDLLNDHDTNSFNNHIRAALIVATSCVVRSLELMHEAGLLKPR